MIATHLSEDYFAQIYTEYNKKLYGFAYKMLKDPQRTEEAVQETFLRFYSQEYEKVSANVGGWLFTVCRNYIFKQSVKNNRYVKLSDETLVKIVDTSKNDPMEDMVLSENKKLLIECMRDLSKREMEIIKYRFFRDMEYSECAKLMKTTENNCHFLQHSAIKHLKKLMSKPEKTKL